MKRVSEKSFRVSSLARVQADIGDNGGCDIFKSIAFSSALSTGGELEATGGLNEQ